MSTLLTLLAVMLFILSAIMALISPIPLVILIIRAIMRKRVKVFAIIFSICAGSVMPIFILGILINPYTWCNHELEVISETPSTCTTYGEIVEYCHECDLKYYTNKEKLPHEWVEKEVVAPTCTQRGYTKKVCSSCSTEDIKYIDETGHVWKTDSVVNVTCTTDGYTVEKCEGCSTTKKTNVTKALGHSMKEVSRTEPSDDNDGTITYKCTRCTHENTETIVNPNPKGSKKNPYVLDADEWHKKNSDGTAKKYINKYVKVTGLVLNISDYNSLKGYYLVGGPGCGLICWVENGKTNIQYGQSVQFLGKVTVEDTGHIEIAECEVVSAQWPTEKVKSPVTMSDWTWSRDFVGGVEWSFRLTNNTDKVVKYITLKWNCYNAVGDLVRDEITGDTSYGVKYTGPLNPRETTDYLSNSTLFYSYSFSKASLSYMKIEFMDGTIIQITDKTYTDILVKELEEEVVLDSSGIRYVVNNTLGTCYVESIGTCTNSYVGILTSLYGDTVTAIGNYAFADATFIEKIGITHALESIGEGAFSNCSSLTYISYSGTIEEWNNIDKGADWDKNTGKYIIYCYDGQIAKDGTVTYD